MNKKIKEIVRVAMVTLFVSYYACSTLFYHTHIIDGEPITHSHPYIPSANHCHTGATAHLIAQLNDLLLALSTSTTFYVAFITITAVYLMTVQTARHQPIRSRSLRAPPLY